MLNSTASRINNNLRDCPNNTVAGKTTTIEMLNNPACGINNNKIYANNTAGGLNSNKRDAQ